MDVVSTICSLCSIETSDLISLDYKEESIFEQILYVFPEVTDLKEDTQLHSCSSCLKIVDSFYKLRKKIEEKIQNLESAETDFVQLELNNYIDFIVPDFTIDRGKKKNNQDGEDSNKNKKHPVKKFKCSVCNGRFISKNSLYVHSRRHSKKLLECRFCGKLLVDVQRLERHTRTHTDVQDYECGKCGRKYCYQVSLDTHMKSHIKLSTTCTFCRGKFKNRKSLRKHLKMQICTKYL